MAVHTCEQSGNKHTLYGLLTGAVEVSCTRERESFVHVLAALGVSAEAAVWALDGGEFVAITGRRGLAFLGGLFGSLRAAFRRHQRHTESCEGEHETRLHGGRREG
jgi:hypothetical protein